MLQNAQLPAGVHSTATECLCEMHKTLGFIHRVENQFLTIFALLCVHSHRYRRSHDSDFTAPLVFYHVWPALMENDCIIMKGEAVTKRGALVRWLSIVTVHPQCLIHKFGNIYKPKDSVKEGGRVV